MLVLGVLTFTNPALLWGAATCAVPVLIHLFLRARPRRQAFPAMQLLMATRTASVRSHRLRNLLLLLLRMLAIALFVVALARPISRGSWMAARSRGPTAAAFVIDDSASMSQRFSGQTRFERGRAWVQRLLVDSTRFPTGSSFAVLPTGYDEPPARGVDAHGEALRTLQSIGEGAHHRSLTPAVNRAANLLRSAKIDRRELYIMTDNTAAAWADAAAGRWADLQDTAVFILDAGDSGRDNARLIDARLPGSVVPPRTPVRVACTLQPAERPVHTYLEACMDGSVVARSEPISTTPGRTMDLAITLPRMEAGIHAYELRIAAPDANNIDDSLYIAFETRPPPGVLVIHAGSDPADADEAERIAALLSPPTLPEDRRPFQVEVRSATAPGHGPFSTADVGSIIWIGEPALSADQRRACDTFVRGGGRLLVMPPTTLKPPARRLDILPARWNRIVTLDRPISPRWSTSLTANTGAPIGLPFDLAFTRRADVDPLASRQVVRYVAMTADTASMRLAEFEGGQPAILARSIGSGAIVQFAFRLDPLWGDLGVRAATAMVMFHGMVGVAGGTSTRVAQLRCGDSAELDCGRPPESVVHLKTSRGKREPPAIEKRRLGPNGRLSARANSAGQFQIMDPATDALLAAYAVNLNDAETRPERVDPDSIRAAFAPGAVVVLSDPASLETPTLTVAGDREWDGYLFLALLALLAGEAIFSNRFYRSR